MTREEAIDVLKHNYPSACFTDLCEAVEIAIQALSVQPELKPGKWEIYVISALDGEGCKCSECGFEGLPNWDYCPNCGSYNGGEQDE